MRRSTADPRKIPQQKRARETVDAIVEAATRICREQGYAATNVNEVARVAGVSVGSLYQYFPSKEALVAEVGRRLGQRMLDAFHGPEGGIADLAFVPLPEAVQGIVRRSLTAFRVDPELRRAIADVPAAERAIDVPEFDAILAEALAAYFAFHARTIRPTNHHLAARVLMTAVESVSVRMTLEDYDGTSPAEVEGELTALVLGYLAHPKGTETT
jgi:AcrR family transcriptional regulator